MLKQLMMLMLSASLFAGEIQDGFINFYNRDQVLVVEDYKGVCGDTPRTICARIKINKETMNSSGHFIGYGGQGSKGSILSMGLKKQDSGTVLKVEFGQFFLVGESKLPRQKWILVTLVVTKKGSVELYIDGKLDAKAKKLSIDTQPLHFFRIGADWMAKRHWEALVDDVSVWNCALQAKQIQKLVKCEDYSAFINKEKSLKPENLELFYSFDQDNELVNMGQAKVRGVVRDIHSISKDGNLAKGDVVLEDKPRVKKNKKREPNSAQNTVVVDCNAQIDLEDGSLSWVMKNESGLKEFRVLNSATGVIFQVVEAVEADLYSIEIPDGLTPQIVAVSAAGKIYKLKNNTKK